MESANSSNSFNFFSSKYTRKLQCCSPPDVSPIIPCKTVMPGLACELIPIGCVDNLDDLALELGCKVDIVPSSYLGLPLGPPFKPRGNLGWGGREVLQKAVCHPRLVKLMLEKIQRDFCGEVDSRAKTLLSKVDDYLFRGVLWKQVISRKYGKDYEGWRSCELRGGHGVSLWKTIRKEWDLLSNKISFSMGNGRRVRF
ncbi:hypothetical protein CK203_041352 [Vitis vinifera]|uniref:Uncharacterized protein n=1 Tax=Vitis vinifera TaxID=29760 RepID=A0A438H5V7_VITVI|nr:hypothetical protein CK203_041352 [Vitis vinifera]